jgi:hypothetical protein
MDRTRMRGRMLIPSGDCARIGLEREVSRTSDELCEGATGKGMYTPLFLRDSELILIAGHVRLRIKPARGAIPERINRIYTDRCVAKLETGEWACCDWRQGVHVLEFQRVATCATLQQALQWLIGDLMTARVEPPT